MEDAGFQECGTTGWDGSDWSTTLAGDHACIKATQVEAAHKSGVFDLETTILYHFESSFDGRLSCLLMASPS